MARQVNRLARAGAVIAVVAGGWLAGAGGTAWAHHMDDWVHDHSTAVIPARPDGLAEIQATYGPVCGDAANAGRSFWPNQSSSGSGYVYYHAYIAKNVGGNIRNHISLVHREAAVRYLVGGYNCRYISGSTSWSLHAWGAAIDTNSATNPMGQNFWDGTGSDGKNYATYLPDVWRGPYPGHKFFWGLSWDSRPDPMHFQYALGY